MSNQLCFLPLHVISNSAPDIMEGMGPRDSPWWVHFLAPHGAWTTGPAPTFQFQCPGYFSSCSPCGFSFYFCSSEIFILNSAFSETLLLEKKKKFSRLFFFSNFLCSKWMGRYTHSVILTTEEKNQDKRNSALFLNFE